MTDSWDTFDSTQESRETQPRSIPKPQTLSRGSVLGRYVIIEPIGAGGMGTVYRAFDPQLNRGVALKILSVQPTSSQAGQTARTRLVREAQALAQLSHPNVVAVHDVGSLKNDLFVAMELVEGKTLRQWMRCQEHPLDEKLSIMLAAGRGLAAAHKAGLIHRDFKPSNVIVGDDGRVRVLDFGLARAAQEFWTDQIQEEAKADSQLESSSTSNSNLLFSCLTGVGGLVGTPIYMAPEQLLRRKIDERADQFAFCLVLYEVLFGVRPYRAKTIRELVHKMSKQALPEPDRHNPSSSWLFAILARGLQYRAHDRFASLQELLDRLEKNPEKQQAEKQAARKRTLRLLSIFGSMALVVSLAWGAFAYDRHQTIKRCHLRAQAIDEIWNDAHKNKAAMAFRRSGIAYAADTWLRIVPHVDDYRQQWIQLGKDLCPDGKLGPSLGANFIRRARFCLDENKAMLRSLVRQWQKPDEIVIQKAVMSAMSLPILRLCGDRSFLGRRTFDLVDSNKSTEIQTLRERLAEVSALQASGKFKKALELAQTVHAQALALGQIELVVASLLAQGKAQDELGHFDEARSVFKQAFARAEVAGDDMQALSAANFLMNTEGCRLAHYDEALRFQMLSQAKCKRLGLAGLHPEIAEMQNNLGCVLLNQGHYKESMVAFRKALTILINTLGTNHPLVAKPLRRLGVLYEFENDFTQAAIFYKQALAIARQSFGPKHPDVALTLNNLGVVYRKKGDNAQALKFYQDALSILQRSLGKDHPHVGALLGNLANVYRETGEYQKAETLLQKAHVLNIKIFGADHPQTAINLSNLGDLNRDRGDYVKAIAYYQRARVIFEKFFGPDDVRLTWLLAGMGEAYMMQGHYTKAQALLEKVVELCKNKTCEAEPQGRALFAMARVCLATRNNRQYAIELAQQAMSAYGKEPRLEERVRSVNAWLLKHRG